MLYVGLAYTHLKLSKGFSKCFIFSSKICPVFCWASFQKWMETLAWLWRLWQSITSRKEMKKKPELWRLEERYVSRFWFLKNGLFSGGWEVWSGASCVDTSYQRPQRSCSSKHSNWEDSILGGRQESRCVFFSLLFFLTFMILRS